MFAFRCIVKVNNNFFMMCLFRVDRYESYNFNQTYKVDPRSLKYTLFNICEFKKLFNELPIIYIYILVSVL